MDDDDELQQIEEAPQTIEEVEQTAGESDVIVHEEESNEKSEKLARLPIARIRNIIKADPDVTIASQESVFLITKATEFFIEQLTKDVYRVTQGNKRKTIQRKDLDVIIETNEELAFLEGTLDLK